MSDPIPPDCSRCAELEKQLAELAKKLRLLEEKLEQTQRESKKQTVKFPRNKRTPNPKKPGRKGGHQQHKRIVPPVIDKQIDVPVPTVCPDCQIPLTIVTHQQFQTDIPPVKPTTIQFNVQVGTCPCCELRVQGRHELQVSDALGGANHVIGANAQGLAAHLKHKLGASYQKISDFFQAAFQFRSRPSTWVRAGYRLAKKLGPTVSELWQQLRESDVIHADETGWRIGSNSYWLWVFCNQEITLFDIAPSRGHEVVLQNVGPEYRGIMVCDGLASYDPLPWNKQRCHAHLLKRIAGLQERFAEEPERDWEFSQLTDLRGLLDASAELKAGWDELNGRVYQRRTNQLERQFSDWLELNTTSFPFSALLAEEHPEFVTLVRHVEAHQREWLRFLHYEEVDRTNNLGERQIRWGVITRKVGGCNQSESGAWKTRILSSLLATCVQQSRSFLTLVDRILHNRAPTAILLNTLPAC